MLEWRSEYFTEQEFGCKCAACGGKIPPDARANTIELAAQLDKVRRFFGQRIRIISGCRCAAHNKAEGGAKYSMHVLGRGADLSMLGWTGAELRGAFEVLIKQKLIKNGGLGTYPDRPNTLHYDTRSEPARWRE